MCIELHLEPRRSIRQVALTQINSISSSPAHYWLTSCNLPCCLGPCSARLGCHLTILFGSTSVMPIAVPTKKRSLLPLLTVLFVFSYGLMTVLIIEQGSVIQTQRNLIKVLGRDSTELWAGRGKAIGDQQMAQQSQAQGHAQAPPSQAPSTQIPSTKVPSNQAPSNQAAPQRHSHNPTGKIAKPNTQLPPVPASDLSDRRRALNTI
jgi:hypothetical protein